MTATQRTTSSELDVAKSDIDELREPDLRPPGPLSERRRGVFNDDDDHDDHDHGRDRELERQLVANATILPRASDDWSTVARTSPERRG